MLRIVVLCLTSAMAAGLVGCQPAQDTQSQSERMLREFLTAWSPTPNVEAILSSFTDDCICENVPREQAYYGKGDVRAYVKATYEAVPDLRVEPTSVFVSGEWAACEWVMTGTTSGVGADVPAPGKSFRVRGSSIVQLKDGKIHRLSDYWDKATFLRQIGS